MNAELIEKAKATLSEVGFPSYGQRAKYKEVEKNVWKPTGIMHTMISYTKKVVVDGETYSRTDNIEAAIVYDNQDFQEGKSVFAITKLGDVVELWRKMRIVKLEFAPFFSCDVWTSVECGLIEPMAIDCVDEEGKLVSDYSENNTARMYRQIAKCKGIETRNSKNVSCWVVKNPLAVKFAHSVFDYGFQNTVDVIYRYDDLLNMDCRKFRHLNVLKNEIKETPPLRDSINPMLFVRPLTDIEKLECTQKFISIIEQNIKKQKRHDTCKHQITTSVYL